jgi:hypothetical protein
MNAGSKITGNTNTAGSGGGVYVADGGSFSKSGGIVYGDNGDATDNTATNGHAVYYQYDNSNRYYRNADLGIGDTIGTNGVIRRD